MSVGTGDFCPVVIPSFVSVNSDDFFSFLGSFSFLIFRKLFFLISISVVFYSTIFVLINLLGKSLAGFFSSKDGRLI